MHYYLLLMFLKYNFYIMIQLVTVYYSGHLFSFSFSRERTPGYAFKIVKWDYNIIIYLFNKVCYYVHNIM